MRDGDCMEVKLKQFLSGSVWREMIKFTKWKKKSEKLQKTICRYGIFLGLKKQMEGHDKMEKRI